MFYFGLTNGTLIDVILNSWPKISLCLIRKGVCFDRYSGKYIGGQVGTIVLVDIYADRPRASIYSFLNKNEPVHEISNNVVCATSRASDQPAHTRSLIRAFASHLSIL